MVKECARLLPPFQNRCAEKNGKCVAKEYAIMNVPGAVTKPQEMKFVRQDIESCA